MANIKIRLKRSVIGAPAKHKKTVQALGFKKTYQTIEKQDTPAIRGMIKQVDYLVEIVD